MGAAPTKHHDRLSLTARPSLGLGGGSPCNRLDRHRGLDGPNQASHVGPGATYLWPLRSSGASLKGSAASPQPPHVTKAGRDGDDRSVVTEATAHGLFLDRTQDRPPYSRTQFK